MKLCDYWSLVMVVQYVHISYIISRRSCDHLDTFVANWLWYVGFGVRTAVVMNSTVFWGVMPCSMLKVFFHTALIVLILLIWRCGRYVPLERHLTIDVLYSIISQKTVLHNSDFVCVLVPSHIAGRKWSNIGGATTHYPIRPFAQTVVGLE